MVTTTPSGAFRPEHPDRSIDAPFIACEVPLEIARLRAERAYGVEGHAGRTLAKYADLRVVLETMSRGVRLPLHETAERMTLQVVVGRLRVRDRDGGSHELGEGSFAAVDAARVHELECVQECAFLLTLAWPPAAARPARAGEAEAEGTGI